MTSVITSLEKVRIQIKELLSTFYPIAIKSLTLQGHQEFS